MMQDKVPSSEEQITIIEQAVVKAIEERQIEIPLLPDVANRALLLAQNPESDASEMAKLIQGDQALAGHVMRIANSAAYSPTANLVSLQQAIARLGMGVISEVALSAALGAKLFHTPGYEKYVTQHWHKALLTGLWAKEVARQCRANVEVVFLAGLLHSIGYPAILQTIIEQSEMHGFILSEQTVLQLINKYSHEASIHVVNEWAMPYQVIQGITHYPAYETLASPAHILPAQIDIARQLAQLHITDESFMSLSDAPAFTILNLYEDEVDVIFNQDSFVMNKSKELIL